MGKKKKGSGKKGGKKKGGKKKGEPEMSWQEALLAYKINITSKQLEDVRYELKALTDKNERHKERNERLRYEREQHMTNLLKQAKEFETQLDMESEVDKLEVIAVMKDKWEAARDEERRVAEVKEQIARKEMEIVLEERQVVYWREYKDKGQYEHTKQIQLLMQELEDMENSFNEMASHLERNLDTAKSEITDHTDKTLDEQKYLASEKAIAKMDKYSRQEVTDNEWLQRETDIHKRECGEMLRSVEELETENLEIMSELFECTVDDLKISRNFFLTQFSDNDNVEVDGLLEMDLAKISIGSDPAIEAKPQRPQSAIQKAVEDKVFSLDVTTRQTQEEAEEDESEFDGIIDDGEGESECDPYDNYYHFDDEDYDDYLKLGPLELKLLSVTGQKMSMYRPLSLTAEEVRVKKFNPDIWPVTQSMMKKSTT